MAMPYFYLGQPVLTSLSIGVKDDDSFFNPTGLGHTGFAFNGKHYTAGSLDTGHAAATWNTEGTSLTRGALANFPTAVVVVVSKGSVAVLDATTEALNLWMLFYLADTLAYPVNFANEIASFEASEVSWACGKLSFLMNTVTGSPTFGTVVLTFDYAADSVYADYSLAP